MPEEAVDYGEGAMRGLVPLCRPHGIVIRYLPRQQTSDVSSIDEDLAETLCNSV